MCLSDSHVTCTLQSMQVSCQVIVLQVCWSWQLWTDLAGVMVCVWAGVNTVFRRVWVYGQWDRRLGLQWRLLLDELRSWWHYFPNVIIFFLVTERKSGVFVTTLSGDHVAFFVSDDIRQRSVWSWLSFSASWGHCYLDTYLMFMCVAWHQHSCSLCTCWYSHFQQCHSKLGWVRDLGREGPAGQFSFCGQKESLVEACGVPW